LILAWYPGVGVQTPRQRGAHIEWYDVASEVILASENSVKTTLGVEGEWVLSGTIVTPPFCPGNFLDGKVTWSTLAGGAGTPMWGCRLLNDKDRISHRRPSTARGNARVADPQLNQIIISRNSSRDSSQKT
jgi:hypothetical protein